MQFENALCREVGVDAFVQPLTRKEIQQAKAVCFKCPEMVKCRADAERFEESGAVRGGYYYVVTEMTDKARVAQGAT